MDEQLTL